MHKEKEKYDDNTKKNCCFFGHRDTCLNETDPLKKEIKKRILEKGVKTFLWADMVILIPMLSIF